MRLISTLAAVAIACAGCATGPRNGATGGSGAEFVPLVDLYGVDQPKYKSDVSDCQGYAAQTMSAAEGAAAGAVAGALLGAVLGAVTKTSRNRSAGVGAVVGGASTAGKAEGGQRGIVSRCLAGRGYKVLN